MGVRLHSNLFGTFVPFYLAGVLQLSPDSIALVPLLVYASSSLASLKLGWLYDRIGRRFTLLFGTVVSGLALAHMAILSPSSSTQVYFSAIAMGLSQAMVLSTGVNLIS
jgi:MFS family permease